MGVVLFLIVLFTPTHTLDDYAYQCEVESNSSNELLLKCLAPPIGALPRIKRMYVTGEIEMQGYLK